MFLLWWRLFRDFGDADRMCDGAQQGDRHRSQLAIDAGKDGCGSMHPSLLAIPRGSVVYRIAPKARRLSAYRQTQSIALSCTIEARLNFLHLLDLGALSLDDLLAQCSQFFVAQIGLAAHQNRAGMVWDHRVDKLTVIDQGLRAA